jgi:hypothetical protein
VSGVVYSHDEKAPKAVAVSGIYGRVDFGTYTDASVSEHELLDSFDIKQDKIDSLEELFELEVEAAAAETSAGRQKRQKASATFKVDGVRSISPPMSYSSEVHYTNLRGKDLCKHQQQQNTIKSLYTSDICNDI